MELIDGLEEYKKTEFYKQAVMLEAHAQKILDLLRAHGDTPSPIPLSEVKDFLKSIEKWKAGCLEDRTGNADKNSENAIWAALQGAVRADSDLQAIRSIMQLKGFGSSVDDESGQRRAKLATSVLRFLWPDEWGVVDWRVVAMLGLLKRHQWDVNKATMKARKQSPQELRHLYNIIDEEGAREINEEYRQISQNQRDQLPRAADVDMALFGLSLIAWPWR